MGVDTHKYTIEDGVYDLGQHIDGSGYSEAIKGSNKNARIENFSATGGKEDVIDCVRGKYSFIDANLHANKRHKTRAFITIKGGATGYFQNICLFGKSKWWWDISVGDHTIYGYEVGKTYVHLNRVYRRDGKPVRILVVYGDVVSATAGKYRIIKLPKFLVKLLFWAKKAI